MKSIKILLPILSCVFLSSCIRRVSVNTIADQSKIPNGFFSNESFFVAAKKNNLLSEEISKKIKRILSARGYNVASNAFEAGYCLIFNTDIKKSKTTIDTPICIPGQQYETTGNVYGCGGFVQYNQNTQSSDQIIYVPQEYTFFVRSIYLWVYDAKIYRQTKKEKLVWQGSAVSCGDADLRDAVNYLLVSVFKFFGKDTKKPTNITMLSSNKEAAFIRNNFVQGRKKRKKRRKRKRSNKKS